MYINVYINVYTSLFSCYFELSNLTIFNQEWIYHILEFELDPPLEKYKINSHYLIDINECLLNNGHGPCQDTCRNTIGGYECSCDSLQDTVLSADNHTCQTAGPCSVNNAGCSHTCLSTMGRVFCLCPDGFILEDDWKTCQGNRICLPLFLYLPLFFPRGRGIVENIGLLLRIFWMMHIVEKERFCRI